MKQNTWGGKRKAGPGKRIGPPVTRVLKPGQALHRVLVYPTPAQLEIISGLTPDERLTAMLEFAAKKR